MLLKNDPFLSCCLILYTSGEPGNTGEKGSLGAPGVKGDTGNPGKQGLQGVKGDSGDQGVQGTANKNNTNNNNIGRYKAQVTSHRSLFYQFRKNPKHSLKLTLSLIRPNVNSIGKWLGSFLCRGNNDL